MKPFRWFAALLPLACGAFLFALVGLGWLENPLFYFEGNLDVVALLLGFLLSAPAVAYLWDERQHRKALARARDDMLAERSRFLGRLDHELKNPMAAIMSGLTSQIDLLPESPARHELEIMYREARRVRRLITDLRKIAQMETLQLQQEAVDVVGLLGQVVELAREVPAAQERQVKLLPQEAPRPLGRIQGDRALLLAAIYNLVDNAVKFTGPGDIVEVRAHRDERFLTVEVADTGPGITSKDLPFVCQDLYRGDNAAGVPGSGIGLALTRAIVSRHQGQFILQSALPHGLVVTIRLPVTQPRAEATSRAAVLAAPDSESAGD